MYSGTASDAMMGDSSCLFDSTQAAHVKGIQSIAITSVRAMSHSQTSIQIGTWHGTCLTMSVGRCSGASIDHLRAFHGNCGRRGYNQGFGLSLADRHPNFGASLLRMRRSEYMSSEEGENCSMSSA